MKKYTVIWIDTLNDITSEHGTYNTYDDAFESIQFWWKQNNFNPYYIRTWRKTSYVENDTIVIDYGNHFTFYHIIEKEFDE